MSEYSDIIGHREMVFDHVRNRIYEQAIQNAVTQDSIVLDLGAGLGIHGLMAAKAGARKVYLVEPSPAVLAAKDVARANGFDNVDVINSVIQKAELPEKVDLIISVFTGNFLLTEDLLPSLFYARDNYLKDGGKLIPDAANMLVAPVSMPDFYAEKIDCWNESEGTKSLLDTYGLNYSKVHPYAQNRMFYGSYNDADHEFLAEEQSIKPFDFYTERKADCVGQIEFTASKNAPCHGWLGSFNIQLGDTWLSTSSKAEQTHWSQVFFPMKQPIELRAGDRISFDLSRAEFGDWTWKTTHNDLAFTQSSFLSRRMEMGQILKQKETYQPSLNNDGQLLAQTLALFDGQHSLEEIARFLMTKAPELYPTRDAALAYLKSMVLKLST